MSKPLRTALDGFRRWNRPVLLLGMGCWILGEPLRAGDILRGGAAAKMRQTDPSIGAAVKSQQQARASQQDALAKTAQALQAVKAMQAKAREIAARQGVNKLGLDPNHPGQRLPNVPNGLGPGGLQLKGISLGAQEPTQTREGGTTKVTIKQTQQQALLEWETFNVGKDTHLRFDQSAGGANASQWIAFNRVTDPSGRPSQILGRISAEGQVYVINQNGIIFGGASQINVRALTASSLPINENLIARGLLNNPDSQFLFSALPVPAGSKGPTDAFTPPASPLPDNRHGDIVVLPGASITTSTSADGNGGRIMLVGPNVTNSGSLVAPNGQVILAAGLQLGVAAHKSSDASLRGLDVFVGSVGSYGGSVINDGLIEVPRGSVFLAGKSISQLGAIESTTSASLNGRIDIQASYDAIPNRAYDAANVSTGEPFLFKSTGSITFGENSVTRILPEWDNPDKVVGTELALRSQVNLLGKTVRLGENAQVLAPNAQVTIKAGRWYLDEAPSIPLSYFVSSEGQVYLDRGASINVSGSAGVTAPLSQVILELVLRGGELAPAPLQRDSVLRGVPLTVDLRHTGIYNDRAWVGTPLADLTGYVGLIERTVGELTVAGGTVDIAAGESVVMQPGSSIDVRGGYIEYLGGLVKTSRVWSNGHLVDIKDAAPGRLYGGIYTGTSQEVHSRWGVTQTYAHPLPLTGEHYEPVTLHGGDAGRLSLAAPSMALDGMLRAGATPGPRQLRVTPSSSRLPQYGELSLSFTGQTVLNSTVINNYPAPPDIIFGRARLTPAASFALDENGNPLPLEETRRQIVYLSPELTSAYGWGSITLHNEGGNIIVPKDVRLTAVAGGGFKFYGSNISLLGDIMAPSGTLAFEALNFTPYEVTLIRNLPEAERLLPPPNPDRGIITVGRGVTLSTAGLLVDDRLESAVAYRQPAAPNGGSISLQGYITDLLPGSVLDVSGGALIDETGQRIYGTGGNLTLAGGQDPQLSGIIGGRLTLGSQLRGYAGTVGGSLAITAPLIRIGGERLDKTLVLAPDFFSQGGFRSFSLTGLADRDIGGEGETLPALVIAPGTTLKPVSRNYILVPNPQGGGLKTRLVDHPIGVRSPVSLAFTAAGIRDGILDTQVLRGDLIVGEGSLLHTDPLASVNLTGQTVAVLGKVWAPAGSISVSAGNSNAAAPNSTVARTTLFLGERSELSTAGTTLLLPDAYGRRMGAVLPGGSVRLTGNILAAPGALIDVSGTQGWLDLPHAVAQPMRQYALSGASGVAAALGNLATVPVKLGSDAGSIALSGREFLLSEATLLGKAGGRTARGGSLSVASERFYAPGNLPQVTDTNLTVRQAGDVLPEGTLLTAAAIGQAVPGQISGGFFTVETFTRGGFDVLELGGSVQFEGPVNLTARESLRVATEGILTADGLVRLAAPYVALGRAFEVPTLPEERRSAFGVAVTPTYGSGQLEVTASHFDIGTLSLHNIGEAVLTAKSGDIRGSGILQMAGHLILRAGQVYPITAAPFEVFVYDYVKEGETYAGSITVEASGTRSLPLSAGGSLALYASRLEQRGTLRAPFGSITLGWDGTGSAPVNLMAGSAQRAPVTADLVLGHGSITSVSAVDPQTGRGLVIPYGVSPDGLTWIDPRGVDITAGGLPEKTVALSAQRIAMAEGATIDLRGGGDLLAYRWVDGNTGHVDILAPEGSFAILPELDAFVYPYAPFNTSNSEVNTISSFGLGYVNRQLAAGDRIYLEGSDTLPRGTYTLLPARYALLPGGVLVTPQARPATGTWELPDGSSLVSGYRLNSLNVGRTLHPVATQFELASGEVILQRAEYERHLATPFLTEAARRLNLDAPLLPRDSGRLAFQATQDMDLFGRVLSPSVNGGHGSRVDISSALDFVINRDGVSAGPGRITLGAEALQRWQAESLIIGGRRSTDNSGHTVVTAVSGSITVDNVGAPLIASDVTLAATGSIVLASGAEIHSSGSLLADDYYVQGAGALVRVSNDTGAQVIRTGVAADSATGTLVVQAGAGLSGGSITLDSTAVTSLDAETSLSAQAYTLNSGRISLVLDEALAPADDSGLLLRGALLEKLQQGRELTLRSYSSLDIYGGGTVGGSLARLALNAGEIRSVTAEAEAATFTARQIWLGNSSGAVSSLAAEGAPLLNQLVFNADVIRFTEGDVAFNNFGNVIFKAAHGVMGEGTGLVAAQQSLTISSPLLTGAAGSSRSLVVQGVLRVLSAESTGTLTPGLGASLALTGRQVELASAVRLPSGSLQVSSTSGPLTVSGVLDVSGQERVFYDVTRYTHAGTIKLSAQDGDVVLAPGALVNVSAQAGGGHAGSLTVSAPQGTFALLGTLSGTSGQGGDAGSFALDTRSLSHTAELTHALAEAGLTQEQSIRVREGDVVIDGLATARHFALSADQGNVTVTGTIDASGHTGGSIQLTAHRGLTLASGARLTVAGQVFDNAGKGGQITLEAGAQRDGVIGEGSLDLQTGATLDLSVAARTASSAALGQFTGKLHLRAPQINNGTDVAIVALNSTIIDPSAVLVEGYRLYDLTETGGNITTALREQIKNDGIAFLGAAGETPAQAAALTSRLLAHNAGLAEALVLAPGAEIINRSGNLTLGTATGTTLDDWDLSSYRFGEKSAAGVLTLRAAGDLVFNNSLSDGFTPYESATNPPAENLRLWLGRLMAYNPLLPANAQSYSYRLTAGADFSAAHFATVRSTASGEGSLLLGKAGFTSDEQNNTVPGGDNALTRSVIPQRWQVIRTGSGDISIAAAGHVRLLNQLATIYTAGTAVPDPSLGGNFDVPRPGQPPTGTSGLGAAQLSPMYPAQYSYAGGNVTIAAGGNIERLTRNASGQLVPDSQFQLPNNWLYRRGTVDPATGRFAEGRVANDILSTSWWVDFSNFFQGVGALGGGNVSLVAGGHVANVDAVVPTNLRVTKGTLENPLAANQAAVELGGGDVLVKAGGNIDAGVYYVERGEGRLIAGGSIVTNATRSVLAASNIAAGQGTEYTQLPTTLFAGRAVFQVSTQGDVILGPVANAFLLPEGLGNSVWYRSYLSSYGAETAVHVSSLGGNVTLRTGSTTFGQTAGVSDPVLWLWLVNKHMLGSGTASQSKPWLRLNEVGVADLIRYKTLVSLIPGTLTISAYSGDINVVGDVLLAPSPRGTLSLLASGAVNALQPNGLVNVNGQKTTWGTSRVVVSDANPASLPGWFNPLGYTTAQAQSTSTRLPLFFAGLDALFAETGSTNSVLQAKQALHAPGLLHATDEEPIRLYAEMGDISGLTLFAPKFSRIFAGRDVVDVSLYIQNVRDHDTSIVTSGRDIIPANASSPLRVLANRPGNLLNLDSPPLAGDIQISGPGSLHVLAGRTLDLGTLPGNPDGTGTGITSIGNARNPYLGFAGAAIVVGAGIGSSTGLGHISLDFDSFIATYVQGPQSQLYLAELADLLKGRTFEELSTDEQKRVALEVFYLVLRDAGRSQLGFGGVAGGGYADGYAAIATLFPSPALGDILTRGRDIRTRNGGSISLFVPGGGLTLANTTIGNPLAPPGIVTESGGNISIFTQNDVSVGIGRIFTMRGGNQIIWSSAGDIAAGSSSKTVQSAPPTRVLIDPQSGAVQTDLAGLATGGGIGVLATVQGVVPGDVDLVAPMGVVDAGDAGIRSSGNLTIAATQVLNAGNIAVSGASAGTPTPVVTAPNTSGLSAATNTAAQATQAVAAQTETAPEQVLPSLITVIVEGYGGGEGTDDEEEDNRRRRTGETEAAQEVAPEPEAVTPAE